MRGQRSQWSVWRDVVAHLILSAALRVGTDEFAADILEAASHAERELDQ